MSSRPGFHDAVVVRREPLSAHLVRVVLRAETFSSSGVPDEWVALVVPGQYQSRFYTVRAVEGAEVVLDVVIHDEGLVTAWAQGDVAGQTVSISDPKGSFELPEDAAWVVLVGDLTALPAIARISESVTVPVRAWVESADGPIEGYVEGVSWLAPPAPGESALASFVGVLEWPAGPGYFWMAGESAQMRDIRRFVRRELGWDTRHHDLMGYWSNARGRQARSVDPGPLYVRGKAAGKSDEQIWMEYDEARRG